MLISDWSSDVCSSDLKRMGELPRSSDKAQHHGHHAAALAEAAEFIPVKLENDLSGEGSDEGEERSLGIASSAAPRRRVRQGRAAGDFFCGLPLPQITHRRLPPLPPSPFLHSRPGS